jgi:hypothetical protein
MLPKNGRLMADLAGLLQEMKVRNPERMRAHKFTINATGCLAGDRIAALDRAS